MPSPQKIVEPILEPELPIIDPHHHLWCWTKEAVAAMATPENPFGGVLAGSGRYMLEELLGDVVTGHNVLGTVFVDAHAMYKPAGPEKWRSLGEVEFACGTAAMAESGTFGPVKACAGIVGSATLSFGDEIEEVLQAHIAAGGGRYRGVRNATASDPDDGLVGAASNNPPGVLRDKKFRAGFKHLRKLGLSYDAWVFSPQLGDVLDLAKTFADTQIILDHVGTPPGVASYAGKQQELFPVWRESMRKIAECQNVAVKLGGLGMPIFGFKGFLAKPPFSSEQLAAEWRPYIETCIELFGVNRCMFESNYPVDSGSGPYHVLWNAFKRITAKASKDDKAALYAGTARKVYRLNI